MKRCAAIIIAALISAAATATICAAEPAQTVAQGAQTTKEKATDPTIIANPTLMKDLLRSKDFRNELMMSEDMVTTAMQNEDVRKEMLIYPDIQLYILRHENLKQMLSDKEMKMLQQK